MVHFTLNVWVEANQVWSQLTLKEVDVRPGPVLQVPKGHCLRRGNGAGAHFLFLSDLWVPFSNTDSWKNLLSSSRCNFHKKLLKNMNLDGRFQGLSFQVCLIHMQIWPHLSSVTRKERTWWSGTQSPRNLKFAKVKLAVCHPVYAIWISFSNIFLLTVVQMSPFSLLCSLYPGFTLPQLSPHYCLCP